MRLASLNLFKLSYWINIPPSWHNVFTPVPRASTPDFSQICLGDTRWCDGLTRDAGGVTKGVVAALALADSSIQARLNILPK